MRCPGTIDRFEQRPSAWAKGGARTAIEREAAASKRSAGDGFPKVRKKGFAPSRVVAAELFLSSDCCQTRLASVSPHCHHHKTTKTKKDTMSWQDYHESIMTAIDNSGISSVATALGAVLNGVTSASGDDRLGLVTAAFAALNGATTITSVVSGKYGDYGKEEMLARVIYTLDAYGAICVSLMTFLLVGGMDWLEAAAYGILPVTLFSLDYLRKAHMHTHPEKSMYFLLWVRIVPFLLLYASIFTGRFELAVQTLQVLGVFGIFRSLYNVFAPESKLASIKYLWDDKRGKWMHVQLGLEQKEAATAALIDAGHTRLMLNALILPLSFGIDSMKAIGLSATVHAACLLHDLLSPKIKSKVYALPREIYLAIALFVGWNLFLIDLI